tara:strand:- start:218 stop:832 length:615 start_codon:yes stop_codon:yes gene_type:complete
MSKRIHEILIKRTNFKFDKLHQIIQINGVLTLQNKKETDLFLHLVKTVVSQQLSKKAASSILDRMLKTSKFHSKKLFEFCINENSDNLHKCGLSKNKVRAIVELKKAFDKNKISATFLEKSSHEIIIEEITKLWGFGKWSADMTLLFFFGRPDVWSDDDVALKRGIRILSEEDIEKEKLILKAVTPFKSYLSLHIWKAIDSKIL